MKNVRRHRRLLILHSLFIILSSEFLVSCARHESSGIKDDLGRSVDLPRQINRVVTLAPNLTEIVFASGAGKKVVCTDNFSNFPPDVESLPKVGGLQPDVEKIVACKPDVVFATTNGNHPNLAPALAAARVPLYVVKTDRLDDIATAIEKLGDMLGGRAPYRAAKRLQTVMKRQQRTRLPSPRVMFAVWTNPLYVAGRKTYADDLFALTGATNAVTADGWPQYSLELLVANPPDILLYPRAAVTPQAIEQLVRAAPELRARTTMMGVDDDLFTRPGPRMPETAQQLNAILARWSMLHQ